MEHGKALLTSQQAAARSTSIETGIKYQVFFNLNKGDSYNGYGEYTFSLKNSENVFLDYCGSGVEVIRINGHDLTSEDIAKARKDGFITLPAAHLKVNAENFLKITFSNSYSKDGNGLHSFIDVDGKQYSYWQTEPYYANKIFPLFDQPDLKGKMTFLIQAPSEWSVIANENPVSVVKSDEYVTEKHSKTQFELNAIQAAKASFQDSSDTKTVHLFGTTPLLSTYLYAFCCGPYRHFSYDGCDGPSIPMTLYCRDSVYKYAVEQQKEIFLFCKRGIDFFESFCRFKYPFGKYDFVFCPEFTVGAMEYPGVITFNDLYLYRQSPTSPQVSRRGGTITHELAHMWFGNLVTMRWWNDLWLNESFADFMGYISLEHMHKQLPFKCSSGWSMMNLRKSWGYTEDQAITTHPIAAVVDSTSKAESIFDGITYSKGAATMKQLYFLIGHDQFSENLGNYFNKYQWKNATLADLLNELANSKTTSTHEAYDLKKWNHDWIEKAGMNEVEAEWNPSVQGPSKLIIHQRAVLAEHPTLRYHAINIAFYDEAANVAEVKKVILEKTPQTVVEFENKNYKAVQLNYEDWGFLKVIMDKASLDFFLKNMDKVHEELSQLLVLRSLYDMVRDAKLKSTDFIETVLDKFIDHCLHSSQVLDSVLMMVDGAHHLYTPRRLSVDIADKIFVKVKALYLKAEEADLKKLLKQKLVSYARSLSALKELKEVIEGVHPQLVDFELSMEEKWSVLFRMHTNHGFTKKQLTLLRNAFSHEDDSDSKKKFNQTIEGYLANKEQSEELWKRFITLPPTMSYGELAEYLSGFNHSSRPQELLDAFYDRFFSDAEVLMKKSTKTFANNFFNYALPCDERFDAQVDRLTHLHGKLSAENEFFQIAVLKKVDELRKRHKAHKLYN